MCDILRPKNPVESSPRVNRVIPTKNWLSFPIAGVKGLPTALSQTLVNWDSIWRDLGRGFERQVSGSRRLVQGAVDMYLLSCGS